MMPRVHALITGAGSGIGRAVARGLLDRGHHVALAGRRAAALEESAAGAQGALVVPADVTDPAAVDVLFARVHEAWGRIDLLFNNAGVFGPTVPVDELPVASWDAVVATNLNGAFLCARAAFAAMKAQDPRGGRIINNGSISAHVPRPNAVAYTATKHAITGLTRALALEGRAFDIAVGQIDVGNAATELLAGMSTGGALQADGGVRTEPTMDLRHAADAVMHMASLPLEANVLTMTVMATGMPYVGRG
jgi:NAD(P)-dependent dehydrogenase (short-subunit alcohol dehydrogenase family)